MYRRARVVAAQLAPSVSPGEGEKDSWRVVLHRGKRLRGRTRVELQGVRKQMNTLWRLLIFLNKA